MAVCIFKRILKYVKNSIWQVIKLEILFCRPLRSDLFLGGVQATSQASCRFLTRMYSAMFRYGKSLSYISLGTFQAPQQGKLYPGYPWIPIYVHRLYCTKIRPTMEQLNLLPALCHIANHFIYQ